MAAIGEMYSVNRSGPKTEPCGTPYLSFRVSDVELPMVTKRNDQISKKEAKVVTVPSTPKEVSSLDIKI
jgi:hypothetical protein